MHVVSDYTSKIPPCSGRQQLRSWSYPAVISLFLQFFLAALQKERAHFTSLGTIVMAQIANPQLQPYHTTPGQRKIVNDSQLHLSVSGEPPSSLLFFELCSSHL